MIDSIALFATNASNNAPLNDNAMSAINIIEYVRKGFKMGFDNWRVRSEEHTSELQSRFDLVCRLLLDLPTSSIYSLSLHDALPIYQCLLQAPFFQHSIKCPDD